MRLAREAKAPPPFARDAPPCVRRVARAWRARWRGAARAWRAPAGAARRVRPCEHGPAGARWCDRASRRTAGAIDPAGVSGLAAASENEAIDSRAI